MIGAWKSIDELESNISLSEATAILNAQREVSERQQRFDAAIAGIDLDEGAKQSKKSKPDPKKEEPVTIEQVKARAMRRLGADESQAGAVEMGFNDPSLGHDYAIMR